MLERPVDLTAALACVVLVAYDYSEDSDLVHGGGKAYGLIAAMGTVAASYVVEACGALHTVRPTPENRAARLAHVMSQLVSTDL